MSEDKLKLVMEEIVSAEAKYVDNLELLVEKFCKPLKGMAKRGELEMAHISRVFSNVEDLYNFHKLFHSGLREQITAAGVANTFLKYADFLKMYTLYVNNYDRCCDSVDHLRKADKFSSFLSNMRKDKECKGNNLMSFLIMPVQRIPLYELLLQELFKVCGVVQKSAAAAAAATNVEVSGPDNGEYSPQSPEHDRIGNNALPKLELALSKIREIAKYVNENKRRAEDQSKLLDLQERLTGDEQLTLVTPTRCLIREGELLKLSSFNFKRSRKFFLFNDMLLWTTPAYRVRGYIDLAPAQVYAPGINTDYAEKNSNTKQYAIPIYSHAYAVDPAREAALQGGFEVIHPKHNAIVVYCTDETERKLWVADLMGAIKSAAAKDADVRLRSRLNSLGEVDPKLARYSSEDTDDPGKGMQGLLSRRKSIERPGHSKSLGTNAAFEAAAREMFSPGVREDASLSVSMRADPLVTVVDSSLGLPDPRFASRSVSEGPNGADFTQSEHGEFEVMRQSSTHSVPLEAGTFYPDVPTPASAPAVSLSAGYLAPLTAENLAPLDSHSVAGSVDRAEQRVREYLKDGAKGSDRANVTATPSPMPDENDEFHDDLLDEFKEPLAAHEEETAPVQTTPPPPPDEAVAAPTPVPIESQRAPSASPPRSGDLDVPPPPTSEPPLPEADTVPLPEGPAEPDDTATELAAEDDPPASPAGSQMNTTPASRTSGTALDPASVDPLPPAQPSKAANSLEVPRAAPSRAAVAAAAAAHSASRSFVPPEPASPASPSAASGPAPSLPPHSKLSNLLNFLSSSSSSSPNGSLTKPISPNSSLPGSAAGSLTKPIPPASALSILNRPAPSPSSSRLSPSSASLQAQDSKAVSSKLKSVINHAVPRGLEEHLLECTHNLGQLDYNAFIEECGLHDLEHFMPHIVVRKVLEAAAIVLGAEPVTIGRGRKKATPDYWIPAVHLVEKPHFLRLLIGHAEKRIRVSTNALMELKQYVANPLLDPRLVYKSSRSAGVLWEWIRARYAYQTRDEGLVKAIQTQHLANGRGTQAPFTAAPTTSTAGSSWSRGGPPSLLSRSGSSSNLNANSREPLSAIPASPAAAGRPQSSALRKTGGYGSGREESPRSSHNLEPLSSMVDDRPKSSYTLGDRPRSGNLSERPKSGDLSEFVNLNTRGGGAAAVKGSENEFAAKSQKYDALMGRARSSKSPGRASGYASDRPASAATRLPSALRHGRESPVTVEPITPTSASGYASSGARITTSSSAPRIATTTSAQRKPAAAPAPAPAPASAVSRQHAAQQMKAMLQARRQREIADQTKGADDR